MMGNGLKPPVSAGSAIELVRQPRARQLSRLQCNSRKAMSANSALRDWREPSMLFSSELVLHPIDQIRAKIRDEEHAQEPEIVEDQSDYRSLANTAQRCGSACPVKTNMARNDANGRSNEQYQSGDAGEQWGNLMAANYRCHNLCCQTQRPEHCPKQAHGAGIRSVRGRCEACSYGWWVHDATS